MEAKVIGMAGIDSYDVVSYASRILLNLNCKVLLIDNTGRASLFRTACNPHDDVIRPYDYRGVRFLHKADLTQEMLQLYDYIFIDFGYALNHKDINSCSEVWIFTDLQMHNTESFEGWSLPSDIPRFLVVRDAFDFKVTPDLVLQFVNQSSNLNIPTSNLKYLPFNYEDMQARLACQYNNVFMFKKISAEMTDLLNTIVGYDFEHDKLRYSRAVKNAKRGK